MITRVETARQEMQHVGDFDYGESSFSAVLCEQLPLGQTALELLEASSAPAASFSRKELRNHVGSIYG